MFLMALVVMSATATEIWVGDIKITGTTSYSLGGGTVSYNENTKVLTINNVTKEWNENNQNCINNCDVSSLTIKFLGTNNLTATNASCAVFKAANTSTTIEVASGTTTLKCSANNQNAIGLYTCDVTLTGTGSLNLISTDGPAVQGCEGASSCNITFGVKNCTINAGHQDFYRLNKVSFVVGSSYGSDDYSSEVVLLPHSNTGYAHANIVSYWNKQNGIYSYTNTTFEELNISNLSSSNYATRHIVIRDIPNMVAFLNSSNFPDANFRSSLINLYNKGYITTNDVDSRVSLDLNDRNISNLQGIQYFNKLENLSCDNNNITILPSLPSTLKTFYCNNNRIGTLSGLPDGITTLGCSHNKLTSLPLLPELEYLYCNNNELTSLPLSPKMVCVDCSSNKFTSLYINAKFSLSELYCNDNELLTVLDCSQNTLTKLEITGCTAMDKLDCSDNNLRSLPSLPGNMTKLYCHGNKLTSLSELPSGLMTLSCGNNELTSLPTMPSSIEYIACSNNRFTTLSITGNENLKDLLCYRNTLLTSLDCSDNALTRLDVSDCTAMTSLKCNGNQLTSLNMSNNEVIQLLWCQSNKLTSLDVQGCKALESIICSDNLLSSLTVQGCTNLTTLYCDQNQITEDGMTTLVNSLPMLSSNKKGVLHALYNTNEENVFEASHINTAKAKYWFPKRFNGFFWVDMIESALPGDVNDDGIVSSVDVTILYNYLLNNDSESMVNGDQDGDGIITSVDITIIYNILLGN